VGFGVTAKWTTPSAIKTEHDQGVEQAECRRGDYEHVNGRNIWQVVVQKAPPGRGGDLGPQRHPPPDCGLADLDAELDHWLEWAMAVPRGDMKYPRISAELKRMQVI
jgi:hypothetical protein